MQSHPTNHNILPYGIFLYSTIMLVFGGGLLGTVFNPQVHVILSELLIVCGATLLARIVVEQTFITAYLPPLIPRARSLWKRFLPTSAGLTSQSLFLILLTVPVLAIFTNLLAGAVAQLPFLHDSFLRYAQKASNLLPLDNPEAFLFGAIAVVVAAPVAEEYLFRGTLLPLLREGHPRLPLAGVLVINAILFSIIHINIFGFVSLAIVGYYFADITTRTRSIFVPITAHAGYNFCNGILFPYILRTFIPPENIVSSDVVAPVEFSMLETGVLLSSGVVLYALWRRLRKIQAVEPFYLPSSDSHVRGAVSTMEPPPSELYPSDASDSVTSTNGQRGS